MKTFLQWAEENNFDLPVFSDTEDSGKETDAAKGVPTTDENRARTGASANYPDAYVRAQYPHKWFNPRKADADFALEAKPKKS